MFQRWVSVPIFVVHNPTREIAIYCEFSNIPVSGISLPTYCEYATQTKWFVNFLIETERQFSCRRTHQWQGRDIITRAKHSRGSNFDRCKKCYLGKKSAKFSIAMSDSDQSAHKGLLIDIASPRPCYHISQFNYSLVSLHEGRQYMNLASTSFSLSRGGSS